MDAVTTHHSLAHRAVGRGAGGGGEEGKRVGGGEGGGGGEEEGAKKEKEGGYLICPAPLCAAKFIQ